MGGENKLNNHFEGNNEIAVVNSDNNYTAIDMHLQLKMLLFRGVENNYA